MCLCELWKTLIHRIELVEVRQYVLAYASEMHYAGKCLYIVAAGL